MISSTINNNLKAKKDLDSWNGIRNRLSNFYDSHWLKYYTKKVMLFNHSIWYDFCELRVIMVRCSSIVLWMLLEDICEEEDCIRCCCLKVDCCCCNSPSLSLPLDVAMRKRSKDSLKLGPLSMVFCCCCSCCSWTVMKWLWTWPLEEPVLNFLDEG